MNYYYDILVNLEDKWYEFYEWEKTDYLIAIKKTPVYRVSSDFIKDLLTRNCVISKEIVEEITDKTLCKNQKSKLTGAIFTDTFDSVFLELNSEGKIISKSKLLIEDENSLNEIAKKIKPVNIDYQVKEKYPISKNSRQTDREIEKILVELKTIKEAANKSKFAYLYYECFHEIPNNYEKNLNQMIREIKNASPNVIHKLAHLIKLSYKEKL